MNRKIKIILKIVAMVVFVLVLTYIISNAVEQSPKTEYNKYYPIIENRTKYDIAPISNSSAILVIIEKNCETMGWGSNVNKCTVELTKEIFRNNT